uniref:Uncharacterized protein n=1 Tax=Nelumbo nucifera TaxID=4432 RepID=A0A822Z154_NELNU|nr:TPA_asm: hypothetical protein HUJ06_007367 [Nelumbo nucifera]
MHLNPNKEKFMSLKEGEPTLKVSESIPGCSSHNPDRVIDSHARVNQCYCGDNVTNNYDGRGSTTDKIPIEEEDSITELVCRKTIKGTLIRSYKNPVSETVKGTLFLRQWRK